MSSVVVVVIAVLVLAGTASLVVASVWSLKWTPPLLPTENEGLSRMAEAPKGWARWRVATLNIVGALLLGLAAMIGLLAPLISGRS